MYGVRKEHTWLCHVAVQDITKSGLGDRATPKALSKMAYSVRYPNAVPTLTDALDYYLTTPFDHWDHDWMGLIHFCAAATRGNERYLYVTLSHIT